MATMKDVASLLGLELYEEFKIKGVYGKYRITEKTLERSNEGTWEESYILIEELFNGGRELEPWKPEKRDEYYFVNIDSIESLIWLNDAIDIALYKMGNCFKTQEEAEKNREKIAEEIIKAGEDRWYNQYRS